jgi:MFS family permease
MSNACLHPEYVLGLSGRAGGEHPVTTYNPATPGVPTFVPDSPAAWRRLAIALAIGSVGSIGMWSVVVALPSVQAEFGGTRGAASLAFTAAMMGFGIGGVLTGRLTDRFGIVPAISTGILALLVGYVAAGFATALWQFTLMHTLIGLGASATFGPLMAEATHWFVRRRGIAVTIAAAGNYLAGATWPRFIESSIATRGWQTTHIAIGVMAAAAMAVLVFLLWSDMRGSQQRSQAASAGGRSIDLGISPNALTVILALASFSCCVAMAMPQVHIVAYCGDLGYGAARGAEMLSLMLAFGIISRVGSGFIADRLGGLAILLIGSVAQAAALFMYLFFDGLTSLYVVSALFGLFQGGIVPSYALIVRETMPVREAATRVGIVIMVSVVGMSFGGWISGVIFDVTGSYQTAFLHGIAWNALNIGIALMLLLRARRRPAFA